MKHLKKFETQAAYNAAESSLVLPNVSLITENNKVEYKSYVPPHDYSQDYLTFVATESGTFSFSGDPSSIISGNTLQYSTNDGNTWNTLENSGSTSLVSAGSKILWKGSFLSIDGGIGTFTSTCNFTVEGNVMSLLYGNDFVGQTSLSGKNYAFMYLFSGCTRMTSAENMVLPAITLADRCYSNMFSDCTSLTTAPSLPATTLANTCYQYMFYNCTSLTTAPSLPATTLAEECYSSMFSNCTSLTTVPELLATTLASSCYYSMFIDCTSLTTAPSLPATTLQSNCYSEMFSGCTSLTSITCLGTNISAWNCTRDWTKNVAANGTFYKNPSMTSWTTGSSGIPNGWTVQNA